MFLKSKENFGALTASTDAKPIRKTIFWTSVNAFQVFLSELKSSSNWRFSKLPEITNVKIIEACFHKKGVGNDWNV